MSESEPTVEREVEEAIFAGILVGKDDTVQILLKNGLCIIEKVAKIIINDDVIRLELKTGTPVLEHMVEDAHIVRVDEKNKG